MILLLLACAKEPAPVELPPFEPSPLINNPARGGPPIFPGAAPLPPFDGVSRATAVYVGEARCGVCHLAAEQAWTLSHHARAYETLQTQQRAFDPSCLRCHSTGLGHPGGFSGAASTPELRGVGCESCHGPGSDHVNAPGPGYGRLPKGPAACLPCHTEDNSPDFSFTSYWPRIAHDR